MQKFLYFSPISKYFQQIEYFFTLTFLFTQAVRQFERAIILRNGKVRKNKAFGPGLVYFLPCVDTVKYTDLRIMCYAVPPQEVRYLPIFLIWHRYYYFP